MNYRKLLCSVMLLGSISTTNLVVYGAEHLEQTETSNSALASSTVLSETQTSESEMSDSVSTNASAEQTQTSSLNNEGEAVDEEEYDAQGNLLFHHPIRFEEFSIDPPAFRSARSTSIY